ncbi:MAG: hypothetical protein HY662_04470 [Chloroflexi bacterium]|nr:hypothetical protein [Chloroflexota bacterium]
MRSDEAIRFNLLRLLRFARNDSAFDKSACETSIPGSELCTPQAGLNPW